MVRVSGQVRLEEFPDTSTLAEGAASAVEGALRAGLVARKRASLVVPGGATPGPAFDRLSRADLDWSRVEVTLTDERWAEFGSPALNEAVARTRLLRNDAAAARFIRLRTLHESPDDALADRSVALKRMVRPFDAVLLGMGEDGHVASLFPGADGIEAALDPDAKTDLAIIIPPEPPPDAPFVRLTLTARALCEARVLILIFTGEAKRTAFETAGVEAPVSAVLAGATGQVRALWAP